MQIFNLFSEFRIILIIIITFVKTLPSEVEWSKKIIEDVLKEVGQNKYSKWKEVTLTIFV